QRNPLAEDRRGQVAMRNIDEDTLAQLDSLDVGAVRPQRFLRIGPGFGIVEEHPRNFAARALPQVLDARDGAHVDAFPSLRRQHSKAAPAVPRPGTPAAACALWGRGPFGALAGG